MTRQHTLTDDEAGLITSALRIYADIQKWEMLSDCGSGAHELAQRINTTQYSRPVRVTAEEIQKINQRAVPSPPVQDGPMYPDVPPIKDRMEKQQAAARDEAREAEAIREMYERCQWPNQSHTCGMTRALKAIQKLAGECWQECPASTGWHEYYGDIAAMAEEALADGKVTDCGRECKHCHTPWTQHSDTCE